MTRPDRLETLPETGTVSVACLIPNGLRLTLQPGGPGTPEYEFAALKGPSLPFGKWSRRMFGGYRITDNVDAAKFKKWWDDHTKEGHVYGPIAQDWIFAAAKPGTVEDRAKEQSLVRTGMEQMTEAQIAVRGVKEMPFRSAVGSEVD